MDKELKEALFGNWSIVDYFKKTGKMGGLKRAKNLSSKRRTEIARLAAKSRWKKKALILLLLVPLVGCKKDFPVSDIPSISSLKEVEKPNFGIEGVVEEHFGYLDSSGLVEIEHQGQVIAFIHDIGTWFQVAVNQESGAAYVMVGQGYAQYRNFHGTRPYYFVIK